jgi:hypothetical protein
MTYEEICYEQEFDHLFDYIDSMWVFPDHIEHNRIREILLHLFEFGLNIGKDWCFNGDLDQFLRVMIEEREENLNVSSEKDLADDVCLTLLNKAYSGISSYKYDHLKKLNFRLLADNKINDISYSNDLSTFVPVTIGRCKQLTYQEALSIFSDHDKLKYYDSVGKGLSRQKIEITAFKGTVIEKPLMSFFFTEDTSLHNVLQYDANYDQRPYELLMRSVISQGIFVAEQNNITNITNWIKSQNFPNIIMDSLTNIPKNTSFISCFNSGFKNRYLPVPDESISSLLTKLKLTIKRR